MNRFGLIAVVSIILSWPLGLSAEEQSPTDDEIRRAIIAESIASYSGSCPCPYNVDRAGRRCGKRSAYSKPGGYEPLCYPEDVSDDMVEAYRNR